jgi:hypothetical protein
VIAAAVIAAIALLITDGAVFYWLGTRSATAAVAQAAAKDEVAEDSAAAAARAKIEADEKTKLAALPNETSAELTRDLWGK